MDRFCRRENDNARRNVTGFFTAVPFRMTVQEGDSGTEAGMTTAKGRVSGGIVQRTFHQDSAHSPRSFILDFHWILHGDAVQNDGVG